MMKRLSNNKGYTMLVVLLVIVLISVLALGVMGLTASNDKLSTKNQQYQSAYYIAEAGASHSLSLMKQTIQQSLNNREKENVFFAHLQQTITQINQTAYTDFQQNSHIQPVANIVIDNIAQVDSYTKQYRITSVGNIGKNKRTVQQTFNVKWTDGSSGGGATTLTTALLTQTTAKLTGGAAITGNVKINNNWTSKTITLDGGASINGDVTVGRANPTVQNVFDTPDYLKVTSKVSNEAVMSVALPAFPSIPTNFPYPSDQSINKDGSKFDIVKSGNVNITDYKANNYTFNLSQNMQLNDIKIDSNYNLYINVGNANKSLVVNTLNLSNGHIILLGTGTLTLYVKGDMTFGSGSTLNTSDKQNQLVLYYKGSSDSSKPKKLTLSGSQQLFGSVYAEDADITLTAGSGFNGNYLLTGGKNFKVTGGAVGYATYFYAPLADFNLTGGGTLYGIVVCNQFTADGGTVLTYRKPTDDSGPFFPLPTIPDISNVLHSNPVREVPN